MAEPPPAQAGRGYQLRLGDPDQLAVSVALAPQHSLVALIRQAASGTPASSGAPAASDTPAPSPEPAAAES